MSEDQPNNLLPSNFAPLNHHDENHQSMPPVFNFPDISDISGEKFNSSYKEDPSKTSFSHSNSDVFNAIYPEIPDNSIQEVYQLKKKQPLADLTNIKNLSSNLLNIPNQQHVQNQIPLRILENKDLSLDNLNPQPNFSSKLFDQMGHFMNPPNQKSLETKQKDYKITTRNDPKTFFYPDTQTSLEEEDFSLPSILKDQPKDAPILAKGSPSKYIDTTMKDLGLPDNLSDIPEGEAGPNSELETDDIQDMKETEVKLEKIVENREDLKPKWLGLSMEVRQLAIIGKIKEAYEKWMNGEDLWEVYAEKFDMTFYRVTYCGTFIEYLGYLFKEALPKLKKMEEFYDSDPSNGELGDKDIGYLYNEIGKCYSMIGGKGHKELAEKYLAMAKERLERCQKERLFILVHCLSTHGEHFLKYKEYEKAQGYFETVLKLTEGLGEGEKYGEPPKNILLGWAYIDLADVLISQGDLVDGERNNNLAIEKLIAGGLQDSFFMGQVKRNQARLTDNVEDSVRFYGEALKILKETLPEGNQLEKEFAKECEKRKGKCFEIAEGAGEP